MRFSKIEEGQIWQGKISSKRLKINNIKNEKVDYTITNIEFNKTSNLKWSQNISRFESILNSQYDLITPAKKYKRKKLTINNENINKSTTDSIGNQ